MHCYLDESAASQFGVEEVERHLIGDTEHFVDRSHEAGRLLQFAMRGVEKLNSRTVTSALTGAFQTDPKVRSEFLDLLGRT